MVWWFCLLIVEVSRNIWYKLCLWFFLLLLLTAQKTDFTIWNYYFHFVKKWWYTKYQGCNEKVQIPIIIYSKVTPYPRNSPTPTLGDHTEQGKKFRKSVIGSYLRWISSKSLSRYSKGNIFWYAITNTNSNSLSILYLRASWPLSQ